MSAFRRKATKVSQLNLHEERFKVAAMSGVVMPEVYYQPVRRSLFLRVMLCLGFLAVIALTIFFGSQAGRLGLLSTAVLAGCAGYFAYTGVGYASQALDSVGLIVDANGFSYRRPLLRKRMEWREVSEFRIVTYRSIRTIAFDLLKAPDSLSRRWNRTAMGAGEYIMAHAFAAPLEQVCETLNEYRRLGLQLPGGESRSTSA